MSAVSELMAEAEAVGVRFQIAGPGKITLKAKRAPPPESVARIKAAKPVLLVALFFQRRYREAIEFQRQMGRQRSADISTPELERLAHAMAWNTVAAEWHRHHGERVPSGICAGCRKPLAGAEVLLLPHGEHAHADPDYACITAYGRRWKGAAASALAQYGIPAPEGDDVPVSSRLGRHECTGLERRNNGDTARS